MPPGTYTVASTITLSSATGKTLAGSGRGCTIIQCSSAATPVLTVADGSRRIVIRDVTVQHSVTATAGGDGIVTAGSCSGCEISNVMSLYNYYNFHLKATDYSHIHDCVSIGSISHGVRRINTATSGTCQWNMTNVTSQQNNGDGFRDETTAGPAAVTLGEMTRCKTYANSGHSYAAIGTASVPINSVRQQDSFFGQDGASGIYLDTYGYSHKFANCTVELIGTSTTGWPQTTVATNVGRGLEITANNTDVQWTGGQLNSNSYEGIRSSASYLVVTGAVITNNGVAASAGNDRGITQAAGNIAVTGGFIGNRGGTYQKYAVYASDGSKVTVVGTDVTANATGSFGAVSNANLMGILNCLPTTVNVQIPAASGVAVGNVAPLASGTINTAAGMYKAGTAYTNP